MTTLHASETLRRRRRVGDLAGADRIMNEAVFVGVYPGLTRAMLDYMIETITKFVRSK
jgi:CDP-6-deoxy-D-xylo-4-hexulose-3-dehydrase